MRKRGVISFELFISLFEDNCALFFESRADMVTGASYLFNHLRKFGQKMHVGSGTTASKTEAMYYPPTRLSTATRRLSRFSTQTGKALAS